MVRVLDDWIELESTMKKIILIVAFLAIILLLPSSVSASPTGKFPNNTFPSDGISPSRTRSSQFSGIVDCPSAYSSFAGKWGYHEYVKGIYESEVIAPTSYIAFDDTFNTTGVHTEGLVSYMDSIFYRGVADYSTHYFYTAGFDNKQTRQDHWAVRNPDCVFPDLNKDILCHVYAYIPFMFIRPAGTLSVWIFNSSATPTVQWHSFSIDDEIGVNSGLKYDITDVVDWNFTALVSGGNINYSWRLYYNYTGVGSTLIVPYSGISYTFVDNNPPHMLFINPAQYTEELDNYPYYGEYILNSEQEWETSYIMTEGFNSPYYGGKYFQEPLLFPNSTISPVITDVKVIMRVRSEIIPPCFFSFTKANFTGWNYGEPWLSDELNGTSWINSTVYPQHILKRYDEYTTNEQELIRNEFTSTYSGGNGNYIIPEEYVWDVFGECSWNYTDFNFNLINHSDSFKLMVTFQEQGQEIDVDYLGIYYTFTYSGAPYIPNIGGGEYSSIVSMIYVLLLFCPTIVIAEFVPKIGVLVGMLLMMTVMAILVTNVSFLGFTVFGYVSTGIFVYKRWL